MSLELRNVLLPTDFSETAGPAIVYGIELTRRFDSQLYCLHVVDDAYQYWTAVGPESLPVGPPPEELLELGRTRMVRFRQEFLSGLAKPAICDVAYGRPFAEIINYARDKSIDLIIMGTHGRGAVAQMLLGSTAEKVVRKAPCAVLTVRTGRESFVMP